MTLDELPADLPEGTVVEVVRLDLPDWERRRLMELGIIPGTRIRPVVSSPLGDPVGYAVRGTVIALRRAQARSVLVRVVAGDELGRAS